MWSLYHEEKFLEPLIFTNKKSQEDIVKEVLENIAKGQKIIFINGVCGTGKSAIALNIAKNLGKSSIIVPGKNLQSQYKKDYENSKYLKKSNGEKLKISVITGRKNHECRFLKEGETLFPKIKTEINSKLNDIFEEKRESIQELIGKDISADNMNIPCKIEIKEKNWKRIREYLKQNKKINLGEFLDIKDVRRAAIASVCPYWCPVLSERYEIKSLEDAKKTSYPGLKGIKFIFYQRKPGCKFYEQFNSYIDSDVIVFNSLKYKLESLLNRKPQTEVEIIDECDEFLDSFSNQRNLNIDRLQNSLANVNTKGFKEVIKEIEEILFRVKGNKRVQESVYNKEIIPLKETGIYDLLKILLEKNDFLEEVDEESYIFDAEETSRLFEDFLNESYLTFSKKDNNLIASIVTTNLAKRFKEMIDKNKIIILMSGTIHSDNVLKDIFGLQEFKIIEAETLQQGNIEVKKTGYEMDCKYENFSNGKISREKYLKALDECVKIAVKPVLVHINSFSDLPTQEELENFQLKNLIGRKKLIEIQEGDKDNELIEKFKKKEMDVLFSTRCARGVDFPGEQCNSIVFTKYPNPNVQDAFWKILQKTKPNQYWEFYKDKAKRELLQKIYRGLRFKEDHIYLLSPDSRVLNFFERK